MTSDSAKGRDFMPGSDTPRVTEPMSDAGFDDRAVPEQVPRSRVAALDVMLGRPFKVLDDGFVRVLDYMGDDAAVVQAARISYGAGTKQVHQDRGLIRYLMRHRHCYDDKTEVLTNRGFVRWPDVADNMQLGIWDPHRETLCYEYPFYLTAHRYRGKMFRVDHGGVDLLVTPDHKMYVRTKVWDAERKTMVWSGRRLAAAAELAHRSMVRYTKLAPFSGPRWRADEFPGHLKSRALLEFLGFFVGDGSAKGTYANGVTFHLKNNDEIEFLRRCTAETGWPLREFRSYGGRRKFVVYANGIGHLVRKLFYEGREKTLPEWAFSLDRDEASALILGLRASDGTTKRGAWELSTTYPRLAEQVQRVALHAGEAAHIVVRNTGMRGVMFLSRMTEPVVNQNERQTSWEDYDGDVYCAATRTGILVVRRNGKIVLSGNTTPFEMCDIKFHVRVPMDTWRQYVRHRTASINEYSTRYSVAIDATQQTPPGEWRTQSAQNRQGSSGTLPVEIGEKLSAAERALQDEARRVYEERLAAGVAREQARKDLPLSTYTEAYWKINLHNLLHFLDLRMDDHAQEEIRAYARVIGDEIVAAWVPLVWEAFLDYRRRALHLSSIEAELIRLINMGDRAGAIGAAERHGLLTRRKDGSLARNRERAELEDKLAALGLTVPWA